MKAEEIINAWGAKKYGRPGKYTVEVEQGGCCYSTYTQDNYPEIRVMLDGKEVDCIESPNFHKLLNEMLAAGGTP